MSQAVNVQNVYGLKTNEKLVSVMWACLRDSAPVLEGKR